MTEAILSLSRLTEGLPPEWPDDLLPGIADRVARGGRKVVVLDDDPTGTQTVHGTAVLTGWTVDVVAAELTRHAPLFFILTNSRSLDATAAAALGREIGDVLKRASAAAGADIEVVSRSDSTLRGHFPGEVDAMTSAMGAPGLPCLVIPCFPEGGRYTVGDVHYVAEGDRLLPAAESPYARDAAFGYRNSNLRRWIAEKTGGRVPAERVGSLSIEDIRTGGPSRVVERLSAMGPGHCCVVNAVAYRDLEVVVSGLLEAEAGGCRFVCRTAASFVRVRAGMAPRRLLAPEALVCGGAAGGLFVVGSYVPKTTAQLEALLQAGGIEGVQLEVDNLLRDAGRAAEIERAGEVVNQHLEKCVDVALFTSRGLVSPGDAAASLHIGRQVSESLIAVVRGLRHRPRYLVAKGGITSSDVATRGLGVRRAVVMGQVLPGVPVWRLGEEARYPGMPYVVFPGNVGDADALVRIRAGFSRG